MSRCTDSRASSRRPRTQYREIKRCCRPSARRGLARRPDRRLANRNPGVGLDRRARASGTLDQRAGDGYPNHFFAPARHLLAPIVERPPNARATWIHDAGDILGPSWEGQTSLDTAALRRVPPDEWLLVEAWRELAASFIRYERGHRATRPREDRCRDARARRSANARPSAPRRRTAPTTVQRRTGHAAALRALAQANAGGGTMERSAGSSAASNRRGKSLAEIAGSCVAYSPRAGLGCRVLAGDPRDWRRSGRRASGRGAARVRVACQNVSGDRDSAVCSPSSMSPATRALAPDAAATEAVLHGVRRAQAFAGVADESRGSESIRRHCGSLSSHRSLGGVLTWHEARAVRAGAAAGR